MPSVAPAVRPAPVAMSGGGGGSGIVLKLVIIGVLVAVVVFTYQLLQEYKQDIKEGISEANGMNTAGNSDPAPAPDPVPDPVPEPPEPVDPSPEPEPDPVEVGMNEEPVTPPVVEPEPEPEPEADLPPGDPELRQRAVGLIVEARKKRDEELAGNARAFLFQLGVRLRSAGAEETRLIEELKDGTVDDRIPVIGDGADLPEDLVATCEQARTKEESIDESYRSGLTRIRDAYVPRLEKAADETTDEDLKRRLLAQAERASDLDAWIELLSPEPERVVKRVGGGFVGQWEIHAYNEVKHWIAHPDGRVTTTEAEWVGRWTILEDGTLEVKWPNKDPFTFTRDEDGEGWTGKNPFGGKASLTPGDW